MFDDSLMPDGRPFSFWDDETRYTRTYHVDCGNPAASDDNPGTASSPFHSISKAAQVVGPGEKVVIHGGVYRECVRPARGGTAPDRMIAYEAAPGERVVIRGSRVHRGPFTRSEDWTPARGPGATIWAAELPPEWFSSGFNPFVARNLPGQHYGLPPEWLAQLMPVFTLRQGMVFANGRPLRQVVHYGGLHAAQGVFWVEEPGLRIHFTTPGDGSPQDLEMEFTAQEQVFAPAARYLNYIRVTGLTMEHAATPLPFPQRGLVSVMRGHHWIIEGCTIRHANGVGMDLARGDIGGRPGEALGGHIVRRNVVSDCGVCGIAGLHMTDGALVEDNTIERIGGLNVERYLECGGLKFHDARRVLLRRNVFRHMQGAPAIWLDFLCADNRVTDCVFADVLTMLGAVYVEMSQAPNWIDHNVFADIRNGDSRDPLPPWVDHGGLAADSDSSEQVTVAHNLFLDVRDRYAVGLHLQQKERMAAGRVGLCRRHRVLNNLFVRCHKYIHFGRTDENVSEGNCFPAEERDSGFLIRYPEPAAAVNSAAWREYFGFDRASVAANVAAEFDAETLRLTLRTDRVPAPAPAGSAGSDPAPLSSAVGPFPPDEWLAAARAGTTVPFPRGGRART